MLVLYLHPLRHSRLSGFALGELALGRTFGKIHLGKPASKSRPFSRQLHGTPPCQPQKAQSFQKP